MANSSLGGAGLDLGSAGASALTISLCPPPFLEEAKFPLRGGRESRRSPPSTLLTVCAELDNRFCAALPITGNVRCCLPCPITDYAFGPGLNTAVTATNWLAVVGLIGVTFLLASYYILPVDKTHRYFLSTSVTFAVAIMQMAFVLPLLTKPDQCFDKITPKDLSTDAKCVLSGTSLLFGGFASLMWGAPASLPSLLRPLTLPVFLRALYIHLQICWQITTGKKFHIMAQVLGWGLPAIITLQALLVSGMSYRLGTTCMPNHHATTLDYWTPCLIVAGVTMAMQFTTMSFCIKVFISSRLSRGGSAGSSDNSRTPAIEKAAPSAAKLRYAHVRQIVIMQWRPFGVVLIIITNVIVGSIIFIMLDRTTVLTPATLQAHTPWLICLALNTPDECRKLVRPIVHDVSVAGAVLFVLSVSVAPPWDPVRSC